MKFTIEEVLKVNGHKKENVPAPVVYNLNDLIKRVNALGYQPPMRCSSGYRDPKHNEKIGGAPRSAHVLGMAMDIADPTGGLKRYLMAHQELLEKNGLRMEHPLDTGGMTGGWCHLDTRPVKNRRIFRA